MNLSVNIVIYSSATFSAAIANLDPAITFIIAVILRPQTWNSAFIGSISRVGWLYLLFLNVDYSSPVYVSAFTPLWLVLMAIVGSLCLEEKLHLGYIFGGILIMMGLYVVLWGKQEEIKMEKRGGGDEAQQSVVEEEGELKNCSSLHRRQVLSGVVEVCLVSSCEMSDEEVVDQKKIIEESSCKPKCVRQLREYQACTKRVEGDESGHKHCTGQYFDYWHCIDKCVAPKLFAKLK
nr:cytochrome b-c1 complex subunit 6 [Ipomoea trifida]